MHYFVKFIKAGTNGKKHITFECFQGQRESNEGPYKRLFCCPAMLTKALFSPYTLNIFKSTEPLIMEGDEEINRSWVYCLSCAKQTTSRYI